MDTPKTFSQELQQWVAAYARANDIGENTTFTKVRAIVRDMEAQKILKPIIFYQFVMTIQALSCVSRVTFTETKIKKLLAILYPDDVYVAELTKQVMSAINIADETARANPANEEVLEQLRARPMNDMPTRAPMQAPLPYVKPNGPGPGAIN
jgi:hypothetical protein